ncbi:hypothetical protein J6590_050437, partial [Homalodisca vitripennis]
ERYSSGSAVNIDDGFVNDATVLYSESGEYFTRVCEAFDEEQLREEYNMIDIQYRCSYARVIFRIRWNNTFEK